MSRVLFVVPTRGVVTASLDPHLFEHVLHDVLGVGVLPQNTHRDRKDQTRVTVVQLCEGALIARCHARERRLIGQTPVL